MTSQEIRNTKYNLYLVLAHVRNLLFLHSAIINELFYTEIDFREDLIYAKQLLKKESTII